MKDVDYAVDHVLENEGGYVLTDRPEDRGGLTYAGISRRANPDWPGWAMLEGGADLDDTNLQAAARGLYQERYWTPLRLGEVMGRRPGDRIEVQIALLSCAVLCGPRAATKLAQRVLGITDDGIVGPQTIEALNARLAAPLEADLFLADFGLLQIKRFSKIVQAHPEQISNLRGWINRVLRDTGWGKV